MTDEVNAELAGLRELVAAAAGFLEANRAFNTVCPDDETDPVWQAEVAAEKRFEEALGYSCDDRLYEMARTVLRFAALPLLHSATGRTNG